MPLEFSATGRPFARCPKCNKIHAVMRRKDYIEKTPQRFHCKDKTCRTTWYATPEEQQQIKDYYQRTEADRQRRSDAGKRGRKPPAPAPAATPEKRGGLFGFFFDDDDE